MNIPSSPELQTWLDKMMGSYSSQVDRASTKNWESTMSPYFARNQYLSGTMATAGKDYAQHYADLKLEYAKELEAQKAMLEFQRSVQQQNDWNSQQELRQQSLQAGSMQDAMTTAAAMNTPGYGADQKESKIFGPGYWLNGQWNYGQKPWWLDMPGAQSSQAYKPYGTLEKTVNPTLGRGVYNSNRPAQTLNF